MCWNDGYERRKFEARQKKQAEEYRALGMTEEQIKEMYEFDLEQYKSDRRYHMHTQPFTSSDFDDGEDDDSESTLLNKFFDELTLTIDSRSEQSRYWWIEEIDNPKLAETIKTLSPEQIELLTLVDNAELEKNSLALLEQIRTIDKSRLIRKIGRVPEEKMKEINQAIHVSLSLGQLVDDEVSQIQR